MTDYMILRKMGEDWQPLGAASAASSEAAVRKHVEKTGESGAYIAIPARSFKPMHIEIENVSRVKIVSGDDSE